MCTCTNFGGKKIRLLLSAIKKRLPLSLAVVYCSIHKFDTERTFDYPLMLSNKSCEVDKKKTRWAQDAGRSRRKIKTEMVRKCRGSLTSGVLV